ncbi:hypothetical protein ACQ4PT_060541 [Festuca glaucescens]
MDRDQARLSLLAVLLTGAVLAVLAASPATGDTTAELAGGMGAAAYRVDAAAALRQLTPDVHRRILASLTSSSLEPNKPVCVGTCAARGRPYTGEQPGMSGCLPVPPMNEL